MRLFRFYNRFFSSSSSVQPTVQNHEYKHPPSSPISYATWRRFTKLNLLNYAAPLSSPPTSPTSTLSQNLSPKTPVDDTSSLYTLLSAPFNKLTNPETRFIGGHPVSYVGPEFPSSDSRHSYSQSDGNWSSGFGRTLHWPWGTSGIEHGPDESEVIADFKHDSRHEKKEEKIPRTNSSSDEALTPPSSTSPPAVDMGGLSPISGSRDNSPMRALRGSDDQDSDPYHTFVKKWCFAEGSPPALGGGILT
jgi:hypothetical protein